MHDFRDSPTRRSSHSTNPEVERRRPRRDTAPPNFRVFKVNEPVCFRRFHTAAVIRRQIFGAGGAIIQKKNKEKEKGKGKEERREKRKKERGEFNLEDPMFPI